MVRPTEVAWAALRCDRGRSFDDRHIGKETVSPPSDGLHEPGACCRIAKRLPNPIDGFVHPVVEIDEGVWVPQAVTKLFPSHGFARPLEQHRQNLKWLLLKSEPHALLPQLAGSKIQLEHAEPEPDGSAGFWHEKADRQSRVYHPLRFQNPRRIFSRNHRSEEHTSELQSRFGTSYA